MGDKFTNYVRTHGISLTRIFHFHVSSLTWISSWSNYLNRLIIHSHESAQTRLIQPCRKGVIGYFRMRKTQWETSSWTKSTQKFSHTWIRSWSTHMNELKHGGSRLQERGVGEVGGVHAYVHSRLAHLQQLLVQRARAVVFHNLRASKQTWIQCLLHIVCSFLAATVLLAPLSVSVCVS